MRRFIVALAFLTRLPARAGEVSAQELARALAAFPAVGLVLGLLQWGAAWLLGRTRATELAAIVLVALHALATGALHLDGVADVCDGLSGGRGDRARTLAIMRDSRIGAHGAVALVLVLLAKVALVRRVLAAAAPWALCAAPIAARFAVVPLMLWFPYAREEGLGSAFSAHAGRRELARATLVALACLAPFGARALVPALCALGSALAWALFMKHKLGGLTGDVYGAAIELAELVFFAASVA
jgi:adenosylcobinamide-GDP ribazoletransferase